MSESAPQVGVGRFVGTASKLLDARKGGVSLVKSIHLFGSLPVLGHFVGIFLANEA